MDTVVQFSFTVDVLEVVFHGFLIDGQILINNLEIRPSMENPDVALFTQQVKANFALIQSGVQKLDAQIVAFNNKPAVQSLSDEDKADLASIVQTSGDLAAAANTDPLATAPSV